MSNQQYTELIKALRDTSIDEIAENGCLGRLVEFFSGGSRDEVYPIYFRDVPYAIYMRRNSSDIKNFLQIFVHNEYEPCLIASPDTIIDLGAYIGLSAIYFKHKFPYSKIICVEPSRANYTVLIRNMAMCSDAYCINAAAWVNNNRLGYSDYMFDGDWGNKVDEMPDGEIEAITIMSIVRWYGLTRIGLLKVDIEATEKRLFTENTEWVDLVDCIACETHDRYLQGCLAAFDGLFHAPEFEVYNIRETSMAVRK